MIIRPGYKTSFISSLPFYLEFFQHLCQNLKMPVENLEEEGLPKNPNLEIAQWKFTLVNPDGVDKDDAKKKLMDAIKENGKP